MAKRSRTVAQTLNRLPDRVFVDALRGNDANTMAKLIQDYFCDDYDSGMP